MGLLLLVFTPLGVPIKSLYYRKRRGMIESVFRYSFQVQAKAYRQLLNNLPAQHGISRASNYHLHR